MKKAFIQLIIPIFLIFAVLVIAYWYSNPGKWSPIKQATDNEPVSQKSNNSDLDTSSWKTYTNKKYKFEFNYPNNVRISQKENEIEVILEEPVQFSVGSGVYITINIKSDSGNLTEENFHEEVTGYKCNTEYGGKCAKVLLNGYNATKSSDYVSLSEIYAYYLKRDNRIVRISLSNGGEEKPNGLADQILSTFKFLE